MENEELPAGYGGVNLKEVDGGARADLAQFAQDIRAALKDAPATAGQKSEVRAALREVMREAGPKDGAHSSQAKDAAVIHADESKKNRLTAMQTAGMVAGVAGALTGNKTLSAAAELLTDADQKPSSLQRLKKAAQAANIKTVGKKGASLDEAFANSQKSLDTLKAVRSMRQNGFNGDTIYGTTAQLGSGKDGAQAFVRECADRLAKQRSGSNSEDKLEFLQRPKPVTQERREAAEISGQRIGNAVYGQQDAQLKAAAKVEERAEIGSAATAAREGRVDLLMKPRVSAHMKPKGAENVFKEITQAATAMNKAAAADSPSGEPDKKVVAAPVVAAPMPAMPVNIPTAQDLARRIAAQQQRQRQLRQLTALGLSMTPPSPGQAAAYGPAPGGN